MTAELHNILTELKQRMTEHYGDRLERLVLFGSHARGDAEPDSDIDVLVVLEGEVKPYDEMYNVRDIPDDLSLRFDAVVSCAFVSVNRYLVEHSPLLINARREGVAV